MIYSIRDENIREILLIFGIGKVKPCYDRLNGSGIFSTGETEDKERLPGKKEIEILDADKKKAVIKKIRGDFNARRQDISLGYGACG